MADIQPAADFQALPLEFIIAAPLVSAVKAQAVAAEATRAFIQSMLKTENAKTSPVTVDFSVKVDKQTQGAPTPTEVAISAPLLSIVPIPHLRIDSITTHFKYEITQTVRDLKQTEKGLELSAGAGPLLKSWVDFSVKGNVASKSSDESTMNRSGSLEITVHASESPIPEGLAQILSFLAKSIVPSAQ